MARDRDGQRWRQAVCTRHALAVEKGQLDGHEAHASDAAADVTGAEEGVRGGWTMASALIAYKTREAAARRRRGARRRAYAVHADTHEAPGWWCLIWRRPS